MSNIKSIISLLDAREALQAARWHLDRAIEARVEDSADPQGEEIRLALVACQRACEELLKPATLEVVS